MRAWLALGLIGCSAASEPVAIAPTNIEASRGALAGAGRDVRLGEGDAEAQRCFVMAGADSSVAASAACSPRARAACAGRCRRGEIDACHQLGRGLLDEDEACATKMWTLACDRDQLHACSALGEVAHARGDGATARKLLERACDGKLPQSCTALGKTIASDEAIGGTEATAAFERACDLDDGEGCALAGARYREGEGSARDRDKSAALDKRACDLRYTPGCVALSQAYLYGHGVLRDEAEAQRLLEQVCMLDDDPAVADACFSLGMLVGIGHSVPPLRVQQLYERACDKGHFDACAQVARDHYVAARYPEAIALATKLIAERPTQALPRYARGMSRFDSGQFAAAAEDLQVLCMSWTDSRHCPLWLYAAESRSGGDGRAALESALDRIDTTSWPTPIYHLFLGTLSESRVLAAAKHTERPKELEQECEAYYYIGQRHMIAGRDKAAAAMFTKSVATGVTNFVEYAGSKAELARMKR